MKLKMNIKYLLKNKNPIGCNNCTYNYTHNNF